MTKLLDAVFADLHRLPDDRQDALARMLRDYLEVEERDVQLSPEQVAEVEKRLAGPREFVSDEDMAAFFHSRGA
jgi:hypothetical protein